MKKLLAFTLLALMLVTAGCNKADTPTATRDTLTIASQVDFAVLDPMYAGTSADNGVNACIFDGLLNMDPQGNAYPLVAESWDISPDGIEYTFNIRKGIKFHNGAELKTSDVLYSLNRAIASPYMALFTPYIDYVEQVSDDAVKIVLKAPSAPFLSQFANFFAVLHEETTEAAGEDFKNNPVGCGAYVFVEKVAGQGVTLKAFDGYYGGAPEVKNLVFKVIPDPSTALVELERGGIDICTYIPPASLSIVKNNEKLAVVDRKATAVAYLSINVEKEHLNNVKLRQALGYAIDRQSIVDIVFEGQAIPAKSMINDMYIGYSDAVDQYAYTYDVAKAKQLLAEAGYPNGEGLPTFKVSTIENFRKHIEIIQANFLDIGVNIEIDILEINAYIQIGATGEIDFGYMSIGLGSDASVLDIMLTESGAYNNTQYKDPDVAELFRQSAEELDIEKRKVIFEQIYKKVQEDAPYLATYFPIYSYCTTKDVDLSVINNFLVAKGMYYKFK